MSIFGSALLWLTFFSGLGAILLGIWALAKQRRDLLGYSRRLSLISVWSVVGAAGLMLLAFLTDDFSLAYVARHSCRSLPLVYKISAFWAGQAGSLLLWNLILALSLGHIHGGQKYRADDLDIKVSILPNAVRLLFNIILLFLSQPFAPAVPIPRDGAGLNPMLQSLGMVIHPPILFVGFSCCLIPIATAVAELLWNPGRREWMKQARPWALSAWGMLTLGIVTGGLWAYTELGWGGYWAWDPVENASLFPWLTLSAFLHALLLPDGFVGKGMLSYCLAGLTSLLVIFGTYLTRSGVLDSVHAFSNERMGNVFLGALVIMAFFIIGLACYRRKHLLGTRNSQRTTDGKTALLAASIVLFVLIFAGVFLGTVFPLISHVFLEREVLLDESFFSTISLPLFISLFVLMGAHTSRKRASLVIRVLVGLLAGAISYLATGGHMLGSISFAAAAWALAGQIMELLGTLLGNRDRRRIGAIASHLGLILMLIGITGSSVFVDEIYQVVEPGDTLEFGGYVLEYTGLQVQWGIDRYKVETELTIGRGGKVRGTLSSSKTFFEANDQPHTDVGIFTTPVEDLYLNLAGWQGQTAHLHIKRLALVSWIWAGAAVVLLGVLVLLRGDRNARST